jgi:hypothetical protein
MVFELQSTRPDGADEAAQIPVDPRQVGNDVLAHF